MRVERSLSPTVLAVCVVIGLVGSGYARADFVFGKPMNMAVINTAYDDYQACISPDGLELYFSSDRPEGYGSYDIWVSKRASVQDPWGLPTNAGPEVNSELWDAPDSMSADGLTLYFDGNSGVYTTTRATKDSPWRPKVYQDSIDTPYQDILQIISQDGLELFFGSKRPGGYGNGDIWVSTRKTTSDPWGLPANLGATVNTPSKETPAWISPDGRILLFTCNRPDGFGNYDMWMTTRPSKSGAWGPPTNLGPSINTIYSDMLTAISPDGRSCYISDYLGPRPGGLGRADNWQAQIMPVMDFNGDDKVDSKDVLIMREHWGQDYPLCDIGPMPWGDGIVDSQDLSLLLQQWRSPGPGASDVPHDVTLSWEFDESAQAWDVYLGLSFEDVNRADRDHPLRVLVSQAQIETTYDPKAGLEFGRTYYWRVDEVYAADTPGTGKGPVWSFTTEPYGYPITTPILATASSFSNALTGPEKTIDGSGIDALDQHSTSAGHMWLSKKSQTPVWIQYELDKVYSLHQMWVWNQNQIQELDFGIGAKDVTIDVSTDGTTWTALEGVPQFAQATGEPNYVHNTTVDFGGVLAKVVRLNLNSNWGEAQSSGLSEVRFFYVPMKAFGPNPATGAMGVAVDGILNWRPGRTAASHEVYLGTDPNALSKLNTVTEHHYSLSAVGAEYDRTYYWKVNEVNDTSSTKTWEGDVWSFSTREYLVVDDFESYNDNCNRVYYSWVDGSGTMTPECGRSPIAGNGSGSMVGNFSPPFAEQTIIHSGSQSMPLMYDNTSEAIRTFDVAQDWTAGGIKALVLFFRGDPTNGVGQLYAKVNDSKVLYNGAADAVAKPRWVQWTLDLASIGTDLKAVRSLCIGVSGPVKGGLYIDDIRLYREAPEVPVPVDPGTAGLVGYYAFEGDLKDNSGKGYNGTAVGDPFYLDSMPGLGKALALDGSDDYVDLPIGTLISTLTSTTIASWANFSNTGAGWERVFDFGTGTSNNMCLTPRQGTNGPMTFGITTPTVAAKLWVAPVTLGTGWHHVAVVIDSSTMNITLYLDGDVVADGPTTVLPKDLGATTQNWLGRSQWAADGYFGGMLDEFRIYDHALSGGEVRYLAGER